MDTLPTYTPEKLNLWDRIFNRYKTIPVEEGSSNWYHVDYITQKQYPYVKSYVIYHKIDRLTGGYKIIKEYHN